MINEDLVLEHYKEPLTEVADGHGYMGCLSSTKDGGLVECHICGGLYQALSSHVQQAHKMTVRQYREKFGLAYKTALSSTKRRLELQEKTLKWLASLTEEQKLAYRNRWLKNYKGRHNKKQPKINLETKNKRGTCPDQLLAKILEVKETLGRTPSLKEFIRETGGQKYKHLIYTTFGSWAKALKMLGMTPNSCIKKNPDYRFYSEDELLEYLVIFTQENNRVPTETDFNWGLLPTSDVYRRKFGTIENARQLSGCYDFVESYSLQKA